MKEKIIKTPKIITDFKEFYSQGYGVTFNLTVISLVIAFLISLTITDEQRKEYTDYTKTNIIVSATVVDKYIQKNNNDPRDHGKSCYFKLQTDKGLILIWQVNLRSFLNFQNDHHYKFKMTEEDFNDLLHDNGIENYYEEPSFGFNRGLVVFMWIIAITIYIINTVCLGDCDECTWDNMDTSEKTIVIVIQLLLAGLIIFSMIKIPLLY